MKTTDTVSLELAKQLHEAGVEIKTGFFWWVDAVGANAEYGNAHVKNHKPYNPKGGWSYYPAPTTDELLEYLPPVMLQSNENNCKAALRDKNSGVHIADTPADALAKLALWVKEQS